MRGFPPFHLLIFAIAFALFSVPLARLTFARPQQVQKQVAENVDVLEGTPTTIRIRFAHAPTALSLKLGDKELLAPLTFPLKDVQEIPVQIVIPLEGFDLLLDAKWPEGTPDTALTIELEPDGLEAQSQTRWASGAALTEILPFQWKS